MGRLYGNPHGLWWSADADPDVYKVRRRNGMYTETLGQVYRDGRKWRAVPSAPELRHVNGYVFNTLNLAAEALYMHATGYPASPIK